MSIDLDFSNSEGAFPVPVRQLRFKRALHLLMKRGTAEGLSKEIFLHFGAIFGDSWNLPVQSMMACSHQPVLLTIDFNPVVGGGSPQERTREDPEDRRRTKRGKHVGHCRQ